MIRKILTFVFTTMIFIPGVLFAIGEPVGVNPPPTTNANSGGSALIVFKNPLKAESVSEVMLSFFKVLIELGAVIVTLAIIYAGFLFVMARGNPEELKKAKMTFFWTIVGGLVLLGAQVIASIIQETIKKL